MKRFRFRFESILKLRKMREEEALRALSAAQRAYQAELSRKQNFLEQLDSALNRRDDLGSSKTKIGIVPFQLEQNFIIGLKQRIVQTDQAIFRASKYVEKALRFYLAAKRQTKMMETLYEKDFAEFKKMRARKEQKEQEDLAVMRSRFKEEIAS